MTLQLRQVARCDRCAEVFVFEHQALAAVKLALREMGWRNVVDTGGQELCCAGCMHKLDEATRKRITDRAGGVLPIVRITRWVRRIGWAPCRDCDTMTLATDLYYRPFSKEHPANVVCLTCAAQAAARRGYRLDLDKLLPREEAPTAPTDEALTPF